MFLFRFINYWKFNRPNNRTFILIKIDWWEERWVNRKYSNIFLEIIIFNYGIKILW